MKKVYIILSLLLCLLLGGCITEDGTIIIDYYDTLTELKAAVPDKYKDRKGLIIYDFANDFPSWVIQKQYGLKKANGLLSVVIFYEFAATSEKAIHYVAIELHEIEPDRILKGITNKHYFNRNSFEVKFNPEGGKPFINQMASDIEENYRKKEGELFDMHCYLYYLDKLEVARITFFTETNQQDLALEVFAPISDRLDKNISYLF